MSVQDKCDLHHPAINAGFNAYKQAHEAALADAQALNASPIKRAIWSAKLAASLVLMRLACEAAKDCAEDAGATVQPLSGGQDKDN